MEERELTDREFEEGLRQVLGSHFQDLTVSRRKKPRIRGWEWVCWGLGYGAIALTALALGGRI